MTISRRDILKSLTKSLTMTAVAGSVLRVIPLEAAEYAHRMVRAKRQPQRIRCTRRSFSRRISTRRCSRFAADHPRGRDAKGAVEAGAPEFIDLITSENQEYQVGARRRNDVARQHCIDRYGKAYLDCAPEQQKEILDLIAYRKNGKKDPSLGQGIEFFGFLRKLTADGFFTSEIGIEYLGYIGNTYLKEFPGCPPVPGL